MALTPEQIQELKSQLFSQIQHLPPDKKQQAEEQIKNMSAEAIESMLKQQSGPQKSIFRMIIDKEVESIIVDSNDEALAVLDIAPLSDGHTLIIPRSASSSAQQIPGKAFELAQKVSSLIKENLKASSVSIQTEMKFGESIIHVIPSYDSPVSLDSKRKNSSQDELKDLLKKIKPEEQPKPIKIKKTFSPKETVKRQMRIP